MNRRSAAEARVASRSLWLDALASFAGDSLAPRPALDGTTDVDVAIVGGGFTGLWCALELLDRDPGMRVLVIEAEVAGFGASGRNGGWASALLAADRAALARRAGPEAVRALLAALRQAVVDLGDRCAAEGIDAHYHRGGTLAVATNAAQANRLRQELEYERTWGAGVDDLVWLGEADARARVAVDGTVGALFTPHCARVQPARLVRGLARAVERRGGRIVEHTRAVELSPGRVDTTHGRVRADVILLATEGYTARLPGHRRDLAPIYSLMIATEPLASHVWSQLGWEGRETLTDARHLIVYAQRTADERIAFGGRGAPYHFASRIEDRFDHDPAVFASLRDALTGWFPPLRDVRITHQWGGPLGVPRDWTTGIRFDRVSGMGAAGGYVGDGVTTSFLAGTTLADLVLGEDTPRTALPWVGHRSRPWEPEPLRWLGINAAVRLPAGVDRAEAAGRRAPVRAALLDRLVP